MSANRNVREFIYRFRFLIALVLTGALAIADYKAYGGSLAATVISGVRKETYAAIATILGALLGFEITAFSIVATLTSTDVMKRLHDDGTASIIFSGFTRATGIVGCATVVALSAIFVDTESHFRVWYEYLTLGFAIWATLAIASTVFLIDEIVRAVLKSQVK